MSSVRTTLAGEKLQADFLTGAMEKKFCLLSFISKAGTLR